MTTTTAPMHVKSLYVPDETIPIPNGRVEVAHLGATDAHRVTFQPGFRWTEHFKPIAGTELCEVASIGYVIAGRAGVRMADGAERELTPGDAFDLPAGHDFWTIGDEPCVVIDFAPAQTSAPSPASEAASLPPNGHRILLENDDVRVFEMRLKPGEEAGMHAHPRCVVYALSSARVKMSTPDGTSREVEIRMGDVTWSAGTQHDIENIGTTDDWGIIIELKR